LKPNTDLRLCNPLNGDGNYTYHLPQLSETIYVSFPELGIYVSTLLGITKAVSVRIINKLVFVMKRQCVFLEEGTIC
jgi:hypothetical protein